MVSDSWALPLEKTLERGQMSAILERARRWSERDYVFFATAANTGLRLCEVLHIDKDDIRGTSLTVVRRKKKVLKPVTIDIVPALAKLLGGWTTSLESGWIFPGRSAPCFIRRRSGSVEQVCCGGHASKREMQRRWMMLLRELDMYMTGRGIHSMRHFAITKFYETHKDPRATQLYAGHSSMSMTERYMAVVDMRDKVQGMEAVV